MSASTEENGTAEQALDSEAAPQANRQSFSAPLVDANYLDMTEKRLQEELERTEKQMEMQLAQFRANNSAAMNVIRLARLGLIASEKSNV